MKKPGSLNPALLFKPKKVLVLGDLMVDVYSQGYVHRISPEAPVLVLKVEEETIRPGGAGNAMLNMVSLQMDVVAMGRVGNDPEGRALLEMLEKEGVDIQGIVVDPSFRTPIKQRLIAENQQLLRMDYEKEAPLTSPLERRLEKMVNKILDDVDLVAISDYAKGFLTPTLLASIISKARMKKKPVIIDPKGNDFRKYQGATLIKPNLKEAITASGLSPLESLEKVAERLIDITGIDSLLVTRAKEGITLFNKKGKRQDFPAIQREVKDVTGAGDTVFAVIAQTLANHVDLHSGIYLANVAAGIAIERLGCARVSIKELKERVLSLQ